MRSDEIKVEQLALSVTPADDRVKENVGIVKDFFFKLFYCFLIDIRIAVSSQNLGYRIGMIIEVAAKNALDRAARNERLT